MTDKELISILCDIEKGLRHWEMNFVDDHSKWRDTYDSFTDVQCVHVIPLNCSIFPQPVPVCVVESAPRYSKKVDAHLL